LAESLENFAALYARGRHCTVGLLELDLAGLLDEGGVFVAEKVEDVVRQGRVVSYDVCYHFFVENMMVCLWIDHSFEI
jgi:hypothetical protein